MTYCLIVKRYIVILLRRWRTSGRLQILEWLRDPRSHFRPQVDEIREYGVCGVLLDEKLEDRPPSLRST